jgi:hypothetical protein
MLYIWLMKDVVGRLRHKKVWQARDFVWLARVYCQPKTNSLSTLFKSRPTAFAIGLCHSNITVITANNF